MRRDQIQPSGFHWNVYSREEREVERPSLRSALHLEQTGDRTYKRWIYIGTIIGTIYTCV